MQIILLCGGKGSQLEGMDVPKPLCTIRGRPLLYHVLEALPEKTNTVSILYSDALDVVEFKKTIIHSCNNLKIHITFQKISIETRGPVETAFVGLHSLKDLKDDDPILIIDNDTINYFRYEDIPLEFPSIGTFETTNSSKPYSFMTLDHSGNVISIKEKQGISSIYSTGLYYFPSLSYFFNLASHIFNKESKRREYFLSDLYSLVIQRGEQVKTFSCQESIALGTRADIIENISKVKQHPMRICFDIDNTLLTYSDTVGSTIGIKPIEKMVGLVKHLHSEGNTIVLQTARGMKSCDSNLGKACGKSAMVVLKALEDFKIPYDEIYFGKPWADIYVDDKCWNQYTNPSFSEFLFNYNVDKERLNLTKNCSNNENVLYKKGSHLIKEGPTNSLEGEIYFYEKASGNLLDTLIPVYHGSKNHGRTSELELDFINGPSISKLFLNRLLTKSVLYSVYNTLTVMHSVNVIDDGLITKEDIRENYMGKLIERVKNDPKYQLPCILRVVDRIQEIINGYIDSPMFKIANVVHGDPWFDNMMYTSNQEVKLLDMKGKIGSKFSLKGDRMTDYAKLYQSILGFDFYLTDTPYDSKYEEECRQWFEELLPFHLTDPVFEAVTACCILKTFYYFSNTKPIAPIYKSLEKLRIFSDVFV